MNNRNKILRKNNKNWKFKASISMELRFFAEFVKTSLRIPSQQLVNTLFANFVSYSIWFTSTNVHNAARAFVTNDFRIIFYLTIWLWTIYKSTNHKKCRFSNKGWRTWKLTKKIKSTYFHLFLDLMISKREWKLMLEIRIMYGVREEFIER